MRPPRRTFNIALGAHSNALEEASKREGISPTEFVRRSILAALGHAAAAADCVRRGRPALCESLGADRLEIRIELPSEDAAAYSAAARREGMSRAAYLATALRLAHGRTSEHVDAPDRLVLGTGLVEALTNSNGQLVRIGRNLNQIARALNEAHGQAPNADLREIEKTLKAIDEHVRLAAQLLAELRPAPRRQSRNSLGLGL